MSSILVDVVFGKDTAFDTLSSLLEREPEPGSPRHARGIFFKRMARHLLTPSK
jgi:hypothetical protein